ncbi:uncharacterized protein il12rb1 [Halichoeres trimaculatus]|uniref:uncharacterized protein il12rb1 n=1 Tax=Halichoeres trimaculatus TaxID=147232 RepID=UPI003D9DC5C8
MTVKERQVEGRLSPTGYRDRQIFPLHLMETAKHWLSLRRYTVVFVVLTTISRGSTCEAPSSPECFRRGINMSMYMCEWSMNTTERDIKYDIYFNESKFGPYEQTSAQIHEERLIKHERVFIGVEAHVGNSICRSLRSPVILADIVKYEAPQRISMSWVKKDLHLNWKSSENHPALAQVRIRQHSTKSWESRNDTTKTNEKTSTLRVSLLRNSSYQVQIRQRSTHKCRCTPPWSNWSPVVDVPAELEENPDIRVEKLHPLNGTRKVTLRWKPAPHAATITGVNYRLNDTQSAKGCPCVGRSNPINTTHHTVYVSYSAVNISVIATNSAGDSPPGVIPLPAFKPDADLKACNKTLLDENLNKVTCLEWYELQEDGERAENAIFLTGRQKEKKKRRKKIKQKLRDFVRYLYFEHTCTRGRPKTVNMCLFYKKEDAPLTEPRNFTALHETQSSTNLSWGAIPLADQRGFLTHYSLCSRKFSLQEEPEDCHNISATLLKYHLGNLTPATKYIITLAGVTGGGVGPAATTTISTQPEKPISVWWSLCLLCFFFLMSAFCPFIFRRFKIKLLPPVPTPIIDFNSYPKENQEMLERKEEVDELTLLKVPPESKLVAVKMQKTTEDMETAQRDSSMSGEISDEDPGCTDEALRSSREGETADLEQLENEFAMLIYRNGLVFDLKTDSP